MADKQFKPLAELTDEAKKHIADMDTEIKQVEKDMDALEDLGLDVTQLRDKVDWAKKARQVIIDRMGSD